MDLVTGRSSTEIRRRPDHSQIGNHGCDNMRILFVPSMSGMGHTSRCLAIAEEYRERGGHVIAFVVQRDGPQAELVDDCGFAVFYALSRPKQLCAAPRPDPAFRAFWNNDHRFHVHGFLEPAFFEECLRQELAVIREFQPDLIVCDWQITTMTSASICEIPIVQISQAQHHPEGLEWAEHHARFDPVVLQTSLEPINAIRRKYGLRSVAKISDLLGGQLHLVPSIPMLSPLTEGIARTVYVGNLLWRRRRKSASLRAGWQPARSGDAILAYFGDYMRQDLYLAIVRALRACPYKVYFLTQLKRFEISDAPNISVVPWVEPIEDLYQSIKLVLWHGGHETAMRNVIHAVPGIVFPATTELEQNGRYLQKFGAGEVLCPYRDFTSGLHRLAMPHLGKNTEMFGISDWEISDDTIAETIDRVMNVPTYRTSMLALSQVVNSYPGPSAVPEMIEHHLTVSSPEPNSLTSSDTWRPAGHAHG
jgi:UDP:flavonoid glycosyltransferase YjiC (YdhE family)